jgi:hypothetical protein
MVAATTAAPAGSAYKGYKVSNTGLVAFTLSHTYATTELDDNNDAVEFGYLPPGITVIGVIIKSADLDSAGSPALVQKITLGSTDIVTGDVTGKTGVGTIYFITPTALTAPTLVKVTSTTAAGTAAAGAQYLTFLYHSTAT